MLTRLVGKIIALGKNNVLAAIYDHGLWHIKACGIACLPICYPMSELGRDTSQLSIVKHLKVEDTMLRNLQCRS